MTGYSLETRLVDQLIISTTKVDMVRRFSNLNNQQRLFEQAQEVDFKMEGSGGSTLVDTLSK